MSSEEEDNCGFFDPEVFGRAVRDKWNGLDRDHRAYYGDLDSHSGVVVLSHQDSLSDASPTRTPRKGDLRARSARDLGSDRRGRYGRGRMRQLSFLDWAKLALVLHAFFSLVTFDIRLTTTRKSNDEARAAVRGETLSSANVGKTQGLSPAKPPEDTTASSSNIQTPAEPLKSSDDLHRDSLSAPQRHRDSLSASQRASDSHTANKPLVQNVTTFVDAPNPYKFQQFSEEAPVCEPVEEQDIDFTLVTQFSTDRLWMMGHHCRRWGPHPISIAVYTDHSIRTIKRRLNHTGCSLEHLKIQTISGYSDTDYPVNILRNFALSGVRTSHAVYVDVDFWESADMYDNLVKHRDSLVDLKTALVLPAFQIDRQCRSWRDCRDRNVPVMPDNKAELTALMDQDRADTFDPTNVGGHGSTRYDDWTDQNSTELVQIGCVTSNRYEPYLVFRYCRDLPPFQEAFVGYGKNKINWIMHLRREGWRFYQLGESFVVHYPHLPSKARSAWNGGEYGSQLRKPKDNGDVNWLKYRRGQIDQTFVKFREWLQQTVLDQTRTPFCETSLNDDDKLWVQRGQKDEGDSGSRSDAESGGEEEEAS